MAALTTENKHGFWEFKKYKEHEWFRFLVWLISVLMICYLILHQLSRDEARYEYERLDKEQLQQINRIYFDSINKRENGAAVRTTATNKTTARDTTTNSDSTVKLDTASKPALKKETDLQVKSPKRAADSNENVIAQNLCDTNSCFRSERVIWYIQSQFNGKVDSNQINKYIRPYLCSALPLDAMGYLGTQRFRVESYFWLVGPEVYFEIIFWSLFGVIANLLFSLGVVARNRTTNSENPQSEFDASELPYQFAKFWYAPLSTLAIVLGYNYFNDQNIVDIGSSKGVIVFAFIGGFYSARLIAFMDRLKEVLLPSANTAELQTQTNTGEAIVRNLTINLELSDASLPAELKNEIAEIGLGDATVTLQSQAGETIKAMRASEDQAASFKVSNLRPGQYTIKAAWSKEIGGQPVNLQGEQQQTISRSDTTISMTLQKSESEG